MSPMKIRVQEEAELWQGYEKWRNGCLELIEAEGLVKQCFPTLCCGHIELATRFVRWLYEHGYTVVKTRP